jgi:hypothetical protein
VATIAVKKHLDLDSSPRMSTFRALESIWRNDPVLRTVVKVWKTFAGDPNDRNELATSMGCAVKLWPVGGEESFWAPGSMTSDLTIQMDLLIRSFTLEDVDGLYWAFGRAVYGGTFAQVLARQEALKTAGAHTGLVFMSQPAFVAGPDVGTEGGLRATGQVRIEIRNEFVPAPNPI